MLKIKNILQAQNSKIDYRILSQENKISCTVPVQVKDKSIDVKIEGIADRIGALENQVQLIDYKTGNFNPKYKQQLDNYAETVQQMSYHVEKKILVFIYPE